MFFFPVLVRAGEFGLARQIRPSRPTFRLTLVPTHGITPAFRDGVHLSIPSTTIGSIPSLSSHAIADRWLPQGRVSKVLKVLYCSSSNGS